MIVLKLLSRRDRNIVRGYRNRKNALDLRKDALWSSRPPLLQDRELNVDYEPTNNHLARFVYERESLFELKRFDFPLSILELGGLHNTLDCWEFPSAKSATLGHTGVVFLIKGRLYIWKFCLNFNTHFRRTWARYQLFTLVSRGKVRALRKNRALKLQLCLDQRLLLSGVAPEPGYRDELGPNETVDLSRIAIKADHLLVSLSSSARLSLIWRTGLSRLPSLDISLSSAPTLLVSITLKQIARTVDSFFERAKFNSYFLSFMSLASTTLVSILSFIASSLSLNMPSRVLIVGSSYSYGGPRRVYFKRPGLLVQLKKKVRSLKKRRLRRDKGYRFIGRTYAYPLRLEC